MNGLILDFPLFSIVLPLVGAVLCAAFRGRAAKAIYYTVSALTACAALCLVVFTLSEGEYFTRPMGHFPAPYGNEIRIGVLEALFALLSAAVPALCVFGAKKRLERDIDAKKINFYFVMLCLMQTALTALAYTNDLFTAYVFIEICTLTSCGLLMIRQIGRTTIAAIRYMIFNLLGSGFVLMGICMLYDLTGYLSMSYIKDAVASLSSGGEYTVPLTVASGLIIIGIGMKSGMFPFHFWMPDTYGYATTPSACILSGLVTKGYIFLLIKIIYRVIGTEVLASSGILRVVFIFGLAGMIFGSVSAIKEHNVNRMIAFSSAAQIGYIYMGIGIGTDAAMTAALFHMFTHALTKPLLFMASAGLSDASAGGAHFSELQGSAHRNKVAGVAFAVGALSMVGMPMFAGFISKLLFAFAAVGASGKTVVTLVVLAVSTLLNAIYFLRTAIRIYEPATLSSGNAGERIGITAYGQKGFTFACAVLILLNIVLGIHATPFTEMINTGLSMLG